MYAIQTSRKRAFPGVVIAGGGIAGCAAALGAARAGAKVLLLEEGNAPGGMGGPGMIAKWMPGTRSPLREEIDRRIAESELAPPRCTEGILNECLKDVLFQMLEEAGVELLLDTRVVDADCENGHVTAFYAANVSGIERIESPCLIDATGDGVAAFCAGASFEIGREGDHLCQGASLMIQIGGVDPEIRSLPESFNLPYPVPEGELEALGKEHLPPPAGHVLLHRTGKPGIICANMTNAVKFDFTDAVQKTAAERLCRKQIHAIVPFLRRFVPGFENCYLAGSASRFGIRESRHFHGEFCLTEEDILSGRQFDDWIACGNFFPFDIHNVEGHGLDPAGTLKMSHRFYSIPLRCCLPAGLDGLLLAGRNISGTHKAHSSFRVMPICLNIGLGTGVAAATALRLGTSLRNLPMEPVHRELIRQGVNPPERSWRSRFPEEKPERCERNSKEERLNRSRPDSRGSGQGYATEEKTAPSPFNFFFPGDGCVFDVVFQEKSFCT